MIFLDAAIPTLLLLEYSSRHAQCITPSTPSVREMKTWQENQSNESGKPSLALGKQNEVGVVARDAFLTEFIKNYNAHPKFRDHLIMRLMELGMTRLCGNPRSKLSTTNFYLTLGNMSKAAAEFVSANLMGPTIRTIQFIKSEKRGTAIIIHDKGTIENTEYS
jgi:hypothetical protein